MAVSETVHPFNRTQEQAAVSRMSDSLGLSRAIDSDPFERLGFNRFRTLGRRERFGEDLLQICRASAFAPPRHRGPIKGQLVLEERRAAEFLHVGIFQPCRTYGLVGQTLGVLKQVKTDHKPGRQSWPALLVDVEPPEVPFQRLPIDQLAKPDELVVRIENLVEFRTEEVGITGPRWRLGKHGSPSRE
jgi:hypothetical protein